MKTIAISAESFTHLIAGGTIEQKPAYCDGLRESLQVAPVRVVLAEGVNLDMIRDIVKTTITAQWAPGSVMRPTGEER